MLAVLGDDRNEVDQAVASVEDDAGFEDPDQAAETFASIAATLLDEVRSCIAEHGRTHPPCEARSSAVAYAQALAATMTTCDRPQIDDGRAALKRYLGDVSRLDDDRGSPVPEVPDLPRCQ